MDRYCFANFNSPNILKKKTAKKYLVGSNSGIYIFFQYQDPEENNMMIFISLDKV